MGLHSRTYNEINLIISTLRQHGGELYEYLKNEWRHNCMWGKYGKYFDQWFDNLTDTQLFQYQVWLEGKMGPFPG